MLSSDEMTESFCQQVSIDDWQRQAQVVQHRQSLRDLKYFEVGVGSYVSMVIAGCGAYATAFAFPLFGMICGIVAVLSASVLGYLVWGELMHREGDVWFIKKRYQQLMSQPAELTASVQSRIVDEHLLVTEITYNDKQLEVERIVVDPHADDALAFAGRLSVRNKAVEEQLNDVDGLPTSAPQQQLTEQQRQERLQLFTDIVEHSDTAALSTLNEC